MTYNSYILAFGPHPDDIEVGAGGALIASARAGKRNIGIDLTPSQMSTRGSVETRLAESQSAAALLGLAERKNMHMEDGCIYDTCAYRKQIAHEIRLYRPEIVLIPWTKDRHPDHENAAQLIKNAIFYAGLEKVDTDGLPPHKPRLLLHYMIFHSFDPDLIIPLDDDVYEQKMQALHAYDSQHQTNEWSYEMIRARHIMHGHEIGTHYGEGYKTYSHHIGVKSFDDVVGGFF